MGEGDAEKPPGGRSYVQMLKLFAVSVSFCCVTLSAQAIQALNTDPHPEHVEMMRRVFTRLRAGKFSLPAVGLGLVMDDMINAGACLDCKPPKLIIFHGLVDFLAGHDGEFAAVVAHELGHFIDASQPKQRLATDGILGRFEARQHQQDHERIADCLGVKYLIGAGYDKYDVAAVWGRFMMLRPTETHLVGQISSVFQSEHPLTIERINISRSCAEEMERTGH